MRYLKITIIMLFIFTEIYAAGIFNLGIMAGAAGDAGDIENVAGDINREMRSVAGAVVTEIEPTYAPVFSANLAYISGTLFIKTGIEYSTNTFYSLAGSVESGGSVNTVSIDYTRYTFPLSFGMAIPFSDRNRIYFAGGINMSHVLMTVKQSDPAGVNLPSYPDDSHTFSVYIAGTHLKFGAETLFDRNYTIAVEFTKFFGNAKKVESEDENSTILMGMNAFEVTAGISYNVDFNL